MEQSAPRDLKFGIIYIYSDPDRMPRLHDAERFLHDLVSPMNIQWVIEPGREDALITARRFNVGNIGHYATVSLRLTDRNVYGSPNRAFHEFADVLTSVSDVAEGDIMLKGDDYVDFPCLHWDDGGISPMASQDKTAVREEKRKPHRWSRLQKSLHGMLTEECCCDSQAPIREPDLQEEEDEEIARMERERKKALERIRRQIVNYIAHYQDDPKNLIQELLRGKVVVGQPGRILVNGDLRIVLPEYDEMEIEMPAMCRTLYILFMRERVKGVGGIVLRNIDEYHNDILDIYGLVKPGANEDRVIRSVDNLCDPLSNSLNQMISKINRCIKNVITDTDLARQYTITGTKGEKYGIALDPQHMELPRAITE